MPTRHTTARAADLYLAVAARAVARHGGDAAGATIDAADAMVHRVCDDEEARAVAVAVRPARAAVAAAAERDPARRVKPRARALAVSTQSRQYVPQVLSVIHGGDPYMMRRY